MVKENLRILVVDDEKDYCEVLKMILENNGYVVETCFNGKEALDILEERSFDVVVSDLSMPVMDGFELLKNIKEREYDTEVLILTAFGTIEKAVETMKNGAYSYVTKGNDPEELLIEVRKIRDMRAAAMKNRVLEEQVRGGYMLQSQNPQYRQMLMMAERAAASEANILILGESGAGKEVLATFIHEKSNRKNASLLDLNCQALSDSILESELFGHEKGAFTGANQRRIGLFEAAHGGTLFLDEIGGVSMNLQAKLLKAIENKMIYRMGSNTPITVDFRLITATNRNLKEDMDKELFRGDLFYSAGDTAAQRKTGGHTALHRLLHGEVRQGDEKDEHRDERQGEEHARKLRLPGQCQRAQEHSGKVHGAVGARGGARGVSAVGYAFGKACQDCHEHFRDGLHGITQGVQEQGREDLYRGAAV